MEIDKNLLMLDISSSTIAGVTYKVSNPDIIDVNGEAIETSTFHIYRGINTILKTGCKYKLSGCPKIEGTPCWITIYDTNNKKVISCDRGEGDKFEVKTLIKNIDIYIRVKKGKLVDNIVFKPLLVNVSDIKNGLLERENNLYDYLQALEIKTDYITKMLEKIFSTIEDLSDKMKAIQENLQDVKIRNHDIQDRIYDSIALSKDISLHNTDVQDQIYILKDIVNDTKIRTNDIQDRVYEIIAQENAKDAQNKLLFWSIYKNNDEEFDDAKKRFFKQLPKEKGLMDIKQKIILLIFKEINRLCIKHKINYWLDYGTLLGAVRHEGFIPWDDDIDIGMPRCDLYRLQEVIKESEIIELTPLYTISNFNINNINRVKVKGIDCPLFVDIFIYDYCDGSIPDIWEKFLNIRKKLVKNCLKYKNSDNEITPYTASLDAVERNAVVNEERLQSIHMELENAEKELESIIGLSKEKGSAIIWGYDNFTFSKIIRMFSTKDVFPLIDLKFEDMMALGPCNYDEILEQRFGDILKLPGDILSHEHFKDSKLMDSLKEVYLYMTQKLNS